MMSRICSSGTVTVNAIVVSLCVIVGALVLDVAPGTAARGHVFVGPLGASPILAARPAQFGGPEGGGGAGQFAGPQGIAVEQESGDVYVADTQNQRIDKFGPGGEFLLAFGWGVADGRTEALQTCAAQCFAGLERSGAGAFAHPEGIAIDNDPASPSHGDVYVVDALNHRVEKFTPNGEFILMLGGEGTGPGQFQGLQGRSVAVDSAGRLYVGDENRVQRFSSAGALEAQIALPGRGVVQDLAVDSTGALYVQSSGLPGVRKYDGTGTELPGLPRDEAGFPSAIAIGPADELFVEDFNASHIFAYDSSGKQLSSMLEEGGERLAFGEAAASLFVLHQTFVHVVSPLVPGKPYVIADSQSATNVQPSTATLNATLNPEGGGATTYRFEYGTTEAYGQSTPVEELIGGSFEEQAATAALAGLQPHTVYHFRVVATNAAAETSAGPDQTFETLPAVSIDSTSASQITATSAHLEAELNAHGLPTTYHFEYDTRPYALGEARHGISTAVASAGSSGEDAVFGLLVQGLTSGTEYHYRVVAENRLGHVDGEDSTFTTERTTSSALPDGRAWEMVSPPNKNGVPLEAISHSGGIIQASEDGGGLAYFARGATDAEPASNRSFADQQLLALRGPSGWSTQDIATPHPAGAGLFSLSEYALFSADLSLAAVEPDGATPLSAQASERTPYLRRNFPSGHADQPCTESCYQPLVSGCPEAGQPCPRVVEEHADVPPGTKFGGEENPTRPEVFANGTQFQTATPDLGHLLLVSPSALTSPSFSSGGENIYEWTAGSLDLVSQVPPEAAAACGAGGPPCVPVPAYIGYKNESVRHAISADGSRVFFDNSGETEQHIFMRDQSRDETLRLDIPQPGAAGGNGVPIFQDASTDGTKVFFTDNAALTTNSNASVNAAKGELYMCTIVTEAGHLTCQLKDLTVAQSGQSADVQSTVVGSAPDGSLVYLVANASLAPRAVSGNCREGLPLSEAVSTTCNLYSVDTVSGATTLVAVLSGADAGDWGGNNSTPGLLAIMTARISPNGRYLAFMSQRPLTGYDNRDAHSGQRDQEVYLYDSQTAKLRCASCNPTGARPVGFAESASGFPPFPLVDRPSLWPGQTLAALIPGWTRRSDKYALYQSRYLSDSGRLYFDAFDSLVPQDQNATADVYQYEPPKSEATPPNDTCAAGSSTYNPRSEGCVDLLSSGTSGEESAFLDASQSGDDVFFLTASRLTARDEDNALDVYDAHVCSAESPCPPPPPPAPPACEGDACQSPVVPPNDASPGSLTFHGPGNLAPAPSKPAVKAKPLTRAQKLRRALKACKKIKSRRRRAKCQKQAHRRYAPRGSSFAKHVGAGARTKR